MRSKVKRFPEKYRLILFENLAFILQKLWVALRAAVFPLTNGYHVEI